MKHPLVCMVVALACGAGIGLAEDQRVPGEAEARQEASRASGRGSGGAGDAVAALPAAVRETIQAQAHGREVVDVDQEVWQGRTVYEVEFQDGGPGAQIHVAEDGVLMRPDDVRGALGGALFLGTQVSDTPPPVQETIRREAAGRAVNDIDVERRTGSLIYEVEIRDPSGVMIQLHIAPDGEIVRDSRPVHPSPRG